MIKASPRSFLRACCLAWVVALLASASAFAQHQLHGVTADLILNQKIFMAGEDMSVQLRIINRSGETISLGDSDDWVRFSIRGANDYSAPQTGDMPVANPFTLATGMMATRAFNPAPYFDVRKPGRYTLNATVQLPQWHESIDCKPIPINVVQGAPLVDIPPIEFGIAPAPDVTNAVPETRRYNLAEVAYETDQLKLYFRLSDASGRTLRCYPAGPLLSFSSPKAQIDKFNNLHLLWQTGARDFTYEVFLPDGDMLLRETHVITETRPHLSTNDNGNLIIAGGVRRFSPQDIPTPIVQSAKP